MLNYPNYQLHLQTRARGSEGQAGHLLGVETQVLLSPKFLPLTMLFHHPQQQLGGGDGSPSSRQPEEARGPWLKVGAVALVCCSTHFTLACSGVDHQVSVWQGLNQLLDNPSGCGAGHTPRKLRPPWFQDPARNLLTIA